MSSTKDTVTELCYKTSDKIINILDGLQYSSQRKPSYETELRDLIAIEVRRNVNDVVAAFYNNITKTVTVEKCQCGQKQCICPEPSFPEENTPVPLENTFITNEPDGCCGGECGCRE